MVRLGVVVVAVVGLVLLVVGGLKATAFAPSDTVTATLTGADQPVVSTAVGLLTLKGPHLEVHASGPGSASTPVFIGIGRAADVDAYLGSASRLQGIGRGGGGALVTRRLGAQPGLPDPAGVDVWVVSARGSGSADLVWPGAAGQWRMVVATDGTLKAPGRITLTWSGASRHSSAPAFLAVGVALIVAALVMLVMLRARSRVGER